MARDELDPVISIALDTLTPAERSVVLMMFWDGFTLRMAGTQLSVSTGRIRQVKCKAIRKLQHPVRSRWLRLIYNEYCASPRERYACI